MLLIKRKRKCIFHLNKKNIFDKNTFFFLSSSNNYNFSEYWYGCCGFYYSMNYKYIIKTENLISVGRALATWVVA